MASKNAELRVSTGVTFTGADQLIYMRSHVNLVDGLLQSGRINPSLLPSSVYGGMRIIDFAGITLATTHDTTTELNTLITSYIVGHGGVERGCYFVSNVAFNLTCDATHKVFSEDGELEGTGTVAIGVGDIILCTGGPGEEVGWTYVVIHNDRDAATQSLSGLMSAQDKVDLDTLMALFDSDGDSVINTIAEILAIFEDYPE